MKKIILSAFALLTFGFANAQEVKFGVKGGVNFATLIGDAENADMKFGFHVGGLAEIMLMENFAIQPELLFSLQGATTETSFFDEKIESVSSLYYINLPIMVKYYVITDKLALEAGPQVGFLMSVNNETTITFEGGEESDSNTDKDGYSSVDFGINAGASYNFTENVFASARYCVGLSNIYSEAESGNVKNAVIQLSVGYKF